VMWACGSSAIKGSDRYGPGGAPPGCTRA
jgi:hypothetical protein